MKKLTIEQLEELLEFHYEYDDSVTLRNHIEAIYEQEMGNMKFCGCGCIIAKNEYKCDDCKEGW